MKSKYTLIRTVCAIAAIGLLLFAGCKKVPANLVDAGTMTANAGGSAFTATNCYVSFVLSTTNDFYIKGTSIDGETFIVIRLRGEKLIQGDYSLSDPANSATYFTTSNTEYANTGTVRIVTDSAGIATTGTFNFTTQHGVAVTGGSFRAVFK